MSYFLSSLDWEKILEGYKESQIKGKTIQNSSIPTGLQKPPISSGLKVEDPIRLKGRPLSSEEVEKRFNYKENLNG